MLRYWNSRAKKTQSKCRTNNRARQVARAAAEVVSHSNTLLNRVWPHETTAEVPKQRVDRWVLYTCQVHVLRLTPLRKCKSNNQSDCCSSPLHTIWEIVQCTNLCDTTAPAILQGDEDSYLDSHHGNSARTPEGIRSCQWVWLYLSEGSSSISLPAMWTMPSKSPSSSAQLEQPHTLSSVILLHWALWAAIWGPSQPFFESKHSVITERFHFTNGSKPWGKAHWLLHGI